MGITTAIKLGVVALSLFVVGYFIWSYQDMKMDLQIEQIKNEALEHNQKVLLDTVNTMRRLQDASKAIENAPNDAVADFLRTGVLPKRTNNKVPTNLAPHAR